jgi:hypothetical protein
VLLPPDVVQPFQQDIGVVGVEVATQQEWVQEQAAVLPPHPSCKQQDSKPTNRQLCSSRRLP